MDLPGPRHHPSDFVPLPRAGGVPGVDDHVLTDAAMALHTAAVLRSIESGRAGVVPDTFLATHPGATSVAALELCLLGLWTRAADGYVVSPENTLVLAELVHGQLEAQARQCERTGGHRLAARTPGRCVSCGHVVRAG